MTMRPALIVAGLMAVSGCSAAVQYGKVPHNVYVADPRCQADHSGGQTSQALPYFVVTSRLPDCRGIAITLTNQRADRVRYGRFDDAPLGITKKAKTVAQLPLAFESEASWWAGLRAVTERRKGRVLLYVHGYRETFASTSDSASQIARLAALDGALIQYSWPSQGKLLSYAVDETNMYWDERNFRIFLSKLAKQKSVKEIVIVAHSLGARLVLPAIDYVDRTSSNADASNIANIILASPDIDREDFEHDTVEEVLAARRIKTGRRITIYASSRDIALDVSRRLHGYPRLGSPHCFNPFEAAALKAKALPESCYASLSKNAQAAGTNGLLIIDTSDVSNSNAGHSDFLQSGPACLDFAATVAGVWNRATDRVATNLPYVFRLPPLNKKAKIDHQSLCKRR
jgi:predicted alpha/beta hydrolase family esterase